MTPAQIKATLAAVKQAITPSGKPGLTRPVIDTGTRCTSPGCTRCRKGGQR
ncbi:hypothetical protein AB0K60_07190 [Thermopolyspora sp. NPDC052614]|uniref:hypothetical protein n=1 Tax=Thermopolyspora sp. NPDC052614 TaxID=3155682 RepID=UPI0034163971